jgi:hypothetical protein
MSYCGTDATRRTVAFKGCFKAMATYVYFVLFGPLLEKGFPDNTDFGGSKILC